MVETWCEREPGGPCQLCTLSVKPGEHFYRALSGALVHEECIWLEHDLQGAHEQPVSRVAEPRAA